MKNIPRNITTMIILLGWSAISFAGSIIGVVRSAQTQRVQSDAEIRIVENNRLVISGPDGGYRLDSLTPGTYTIECRKIGFEPQTLNDLYLPGAGQKQVDIDLLPAIVELDKMVVRSSSFRKASDMASSTKIMNFDEILRAPGALVDIQRVVQNLPSAASSGDNVNEVIVRGGRPGENQVIMDNIEIPNPNQFADQGSGGGVVSIINPLLVSGLTFNAGAPPAQYGGKASSVIDVKLRDGNDKIVLGGVDFGMAGIGGHIEGPLWPKATFMVSGHKSYLDFVAKFDPTYAIPQYWGLQSKVSQIITNGKIYANFIYGKNGITIENAIETINMDYDVIKSGGIIYAGGVSWDQFWSERFSTTLTASGTGNSFDRLSYTPTTADSGFFNKSIEQEQTLKADAKLVFGEKNQLLIGGFGRRCDFRINIHEKTWPDTIIRQKADVQETGYKWAAYVSAILYAFDRLRLVPGLRAEGFTTNQSTCLGPRLSAVFSLLPDLDLTSAFGLQYQQPNYADLAISPANLDLQPVRAATGIVGAEYLYSPFDTKFSIEGFYKNYSRLPVNAALLTADSLDRSDVLVDTGKGRSYGIELFAQKKLAKTWSWTAAYSFSRSLYQDMRPEKTGWYPGDYDFQHAFTITGGWKIELLQYDWYQRLQRKLWFRLLSPIMPIADRIELSGKWRYLGGRPYTQEVYDGTHWDTYSPEELNGARFPAYHRLDLRYERRFGFGFLQMIYYFDFQNIYNRQNIWYYAYSDRFGKKQPIYQFPFFPVGGIIIGF
jgi:hypothetical protein